MFGLYSMLMDFSFPVTNSKPTYYAVAMFRTNKPVSLDNLNEQRVCFPGM